MPTTTAISPHIREVLERCVRRAWDEKTSGKPQKFVPKITARGA